MGITKRTLIKHKELISLLGDEFLQYQKDPCTVYIPQKTSKCRKTYHIHGSYGNKKTIRPKQFHHKTTASMSASSTSDSDATSSHCAGCMQKAVGSDGENVTVLKGWNGDLQRKYQQVHWKKHLEVAVYMTWNKTQYNFPTYIRCSRL